jgi:hypothetical protein
MIPHRTNLFMLSAAMLLAAAVTATAQIRPPDESLAVPQPAEPTTPIPMPDGDPMAMPGEQGEATVAFRMTAARDYPAAGLRLSLPVGFRHQALVDAYQIAAAARSEGMHTALGVSISAFPVRAGTQPEQIVRNFLDELDGNIAIRRLEVQPSTAPPLAGQQAAARRMTYKFRGVRTVGMVVCFVRTFEPGQKPVPPGPVAYLFTFEVLEKYAGSLDDLVAKVCQDTKLIDVQSPTALKVDGTGPHIRDFDRGYAIRQPAGWAAEFNDLGVTMGRMNYLLGDVISPNLQVTATEIPATEDSRHAGERTIAFEREQGWEIEVLSEGESKLAGREAWQFVLRKKMGASTTQPADEPENQADDGTAETHSIDAAALAGTSSVEVRRLICIPAGEDKPDRKRHFAIILTGHDCSSERVIEMMDTLAAGFALLQRADNRQDPGDFRMPDDVKPTVPMPQ